MKKYIVNWILMLCITSLMVSCAPQPITASPVGLQAIAQSLGEVAKGSHDVEVFVNQAGDIYTVTASGTRYIFSHWSKSLNSFAGYKMDGENATRAYRSIESQGYKLVENIKSLPMEFQIAVAKASIFGAKCLVALSNISASAMFGIMIVGEDGLEIQVPAVEYREYTDG